MKIKAVFVFLSILLAFACSKTKDANNFVDHVSCTSIEKHVLFQSDYINNAWAYTHNGWFINCKGECKSYELSKDSSWNTNDSEYISSEKLFQNYQLAESSFHVLDSEALESMYKLAVASENGSLEKILPNMADAGIRKYSSYLYDENNNRYKKVLLHQEGDFNVINHHPNAITLKEWLIQIQKIYLESI